MILVYSGWFQSIGASPSTWPSAVLTMPKSLENIEVNTSESATVEVMKGRKYSPSTRLRRPRSRVCSHQASGSATRCCGKPETSAIHSVLRIDCENQSSSSRA